MKADGAPVTGKRSTVCVMPDADILVDSVPLGTYEVDRDEDGLWLDTMRGALARAFGLHPVGAWREQDGDWLIDAIEADDLGSLIAHERELRDDHWRWRIEAIASGLHFAGQLDAERGIRRLLLPGEEIPR